MKTPIRKGVMGYDARILADSISPLGHRLTTLEVVFPRLVLAEFNTHRMLSRNSASSRAIPVGKQLQKILTEPFVPERFGINQPGMQSYVFLDGKKHEEARRIWLKGRDRAVTTTLELLLGEKLLESVAQDRPLAGYFDQAIRLLDPKYREKIDLADTELLNVHKQWANRPLEPYTWHTVLVTATEWSNFFALRVDPEAQPEIFATAELMQQAYHQSQPQKLDYGQWHLPLVQADELTKFGRSESQLVKICAGRCCRVSYLTHAGVRDPSEDIGLHDQLIFDGHMSPLEHPARPMTPEEFEADPWSGNFFGWHQYRKDIPDEADFGQIKAKRAAIS